MGVATDEWQRRRTHWGRFTVHDAADVFPLMIGDEFKGLVDDLRACEGKLRHKILVGRVEGDDVEYLIDGRNRYRALRELDIEITDEHLEYHVFGSDVEVWVAVYSLNFHRRHLSSSQLGYYANVLKSYTDEIMKQRRRAGGERGRMSRYGTRLPSYSRVGDDDDQEWYDTAPDPPISGVKKASPDEPAGDAEPDPAATGDVADATGDVADATDDVASATPNVAEATQKVAEATPDVVPATSDVAPATQDVAEPADASNEPVSGPPKGVKKSAKKIGPKPAKTRKKAGLWPAGHKPETATKKLPTMTPAEALSGTITADRLAAMRVPGASERTTRRVGAVMRDGVPELTDAIRDGIVGAPMADRAIRLLTPAQQRELASTGEWPKGVPQTKSKRGRPKNTTSKSRKKRKPTGPKKNDPYQAAVLT